MGLRPSHRILSVVIASLMLPAAAPAQAPPKPAEEPAPSADDDGRRREDRRRQWRERMEQMASATPEERRQMRLDWRMATLTRTYQLTEEQQTKVRAEIEKMNDERREALGPDAEKIDQLREKMRTYWRERMGGGDRAGRRAWREMMDDEEFTKLRDQMRELRERTSFDWQSSIERIEKLLPAEQVEAGRKRREEWMTRWEERRESGEFGGFRGRGGRPGGWGDGWRDRRRQREARVTPPLDQWDQFTQDFMEKYGFDSAQRGTAGAILKDVKERAATLQKKQQDDRASLETIEDGAERARRAAELDEPIGALFTELRNRLEALVTQRQRRQAEEL